MNFLRNLLAAILGTLVAFGMLFFMFVIFISLANAEEGNIVKNNSILELETKYPINDYTGTTDADPFAGLFENAQGLDEILNAIAVAQTDDRIKGISINSMDMDMGISSSAPRFWTRRNRHSLRAPLSGHEHWRARHCAAEPGG